MAIPIRPRSTYVYKLVKPSEDDPSDKPSADKPSENQDPEPDKPTVPYVIAEVGPTAAQISAKAPKTGDASHLFGSGMAMILSGIAAAGMLFRRKKEDEEN